MAKEPVLDTNPDPIVTPPAKPVVPKHWLDGDQYKGMSEELKSPLRKYTNESEAFKGASEAQKKMGTMISPLKADATPEEKVAYRNDMLNKLGVPGDSSEYQIKYPEGFPEEAQMENRELAEFLEWSHQNKLFPEQVQAIIDYSADRRTSQERLMNQRDIETANKEIREAFPDNPIQMLKHARMLAEEFGGEEVVNMLFSLEGKPRNGKLAIAFAKIGEQAYGEASFIMGSTRGERMEKKQAMKERFPNTPEELL